LWRLVADMAGDCLPHAPPRAPQALGIGKSTMTDARDDMLGFFGGSDDFVSQIGDSLLGALSGFHCRRKQAAQGKAAISI
jgi:hypothetical protein